MRTQLFCRTPLAIAVSTLLFQGAAFAYESPVHVFSVNDVMGGFDGSTFGTGGAYQDQTIICGLGSVSCPVGNGPVSDKSGVTLYPVDSEFGFYVIDFLGAQGKIRDGDYLEGYVGNIEDAGEVVGIQVSNAPTLKYKVKPPLGTWCQGLGGTSVKCETEHYTVMEHVLSCYETIPYWFANEISGEQKILGEIGSDFTFDCANAPLDDNTLILENGEPTTRLTDAEPYVQMEPNDKTDMQNNIALSTDYSVQLKDDGKPLYGWGGLHKRPNDIRMYAKLALPDEWKDPEADFTVTKAHLVINHWITNNPNDQLRPEDLENEAATGRKPSYQTEGEGSEEVWRSIAPCYEGDGDFIEGESPATPIGAETVLRNMPFALSEFDEPGDLPEHDPYAFSSDLIGAFTNAYYTTINRDPFEWSYVNTGEASDGLYDFIGSSTPLSDGDMEVAGLELVSGPRWRLKPNKFGQDLPGLEIPLEECSQPPFEKDNTKYETGTPTTTIINLLDWEAATTSPLATSRGWVDYNENEFIEVENGISSNGLPMSEDFDLAVYIKGDSKSTAVYNAQLVLEYEGETDPEPPEPEEGYDLQVALSVAESVVVGTSESVIAYIYNHGADDLDENATIRVTGVTSNGTSVGIWRENIASLAAESLWGYSFRFRAPYEAGSEIVWTAKVTSESDTDTSNNEDTAVSSITE